MLLRQNQPGVGKFKRGDNLLCVSVPVVCVTAQVTNGTESVFLWNSYFTTLLLLYARNSDEKNTKYLIILF